MTEGGMAEGHFKNFDTEREQGWRDNAIMFELAGRTWNVRPVVDPLALRRYSEMDEKMDDVTAMDTLDDLMVDILIPQQGELWRESRSKRLADLLPDANPSQEQLFEASRQLIDLRSMLEVIGWIVEEISGRPTEQSGPSSEQSITPVTTESKESSSSEASSLPTVLASASS